MQLRSDYLTCTEAAALLDVSARTVRRWCNDGTLPALITDGGHHRLDEAAVWSLHSRRGRKEVLRRKNTGSADVQSPLRCLIVEDDPLQADALSRLICRLGGPTVDIAIELDGFGAGLALGHQLPDLLLLDLDLPGLDGCAVLRRAHQLADMASVRVIVHTGNVSTELRAELLATGVADIWEKPLRPAQARDALRKVLDAIVAGRSAEVPAVAGVDV